GLAPFTAHRKLVIACLQRDLSPIMLSTPPSLTSPAGRTQRVKKCRGAPAPLHLEEVGYGATSEMNVPQFAARTPGGSEIKGGLIASVAIQILPLSSEAAAE